MKTATTLEIDKITGANLSNLRKGAGMSQTVLGKALGVTFQQIQKYEKGTNRMSISAAVSLCNAIGCSIDELLGGIEVNGEKSIAPPDAQTMKVFNLFSKIKSEKTRKAIAGLVKELGNE